LSLDFLFFSLLAFHRSDQIITHKSNTDRPPHTNLHHLHQLHYFHLSFQVTSLKKEYKMSFLTEAAARRVATATRQVPRALANSGVPRAAFSSGVTLQKSAVDSAKDTLKTVDRAVSDKLVDGINIGCMSP